MPFSQQLVDDLAGPTATRLEGEIGPEWYPTFFCCSDPNSGVDPDGKEPTAFFTLSPNPALVGEDVIFDGSDSYDPDGSVTAYAWTHESHTPSSGTVALGTLNYGTAGTYTQQLIVTDGTGVKSSPARRELRVVHPSFDAYIATETGVFYGTVSGGTATWSAKFPGVSPANWVEIDPATQQLAEASKTVWCAADGGVYVSNDGGATFGTANPGSIPNQWSDSPAPGPGSLNYMQLLFADNKLFVGAVWGADGGTANYRSWVFYTTDFADARADVGASITWTAVTTTWDE